MIYRFSVTHFGRFVKCLTWVLIVVCLQQITVEAQRPQTPNVRKSVRQAPPNESANNRPPSVTDLFQTSSCLDKPYRCPHKRIQFYLYTRETQNDPELINVTDPFSLIASNFNVSHPTKVVIHGFGGGRNLTPSPDIREAYFTRGDYNVIIVDYGTLVREPCLSQIGWAPRFGARCIAQLVRFLDSVSGTPPDALHLIGYSVGAHIAGLVANYLTEQDGKLGRITGLDPSVVFYQASNSSRDLDHNDAHFVDIIHTGAGVLGQWGPNGHADFYVNGGTSQPGCSGTIFETLSCDHTKVTPYFIESITTVRGFWAAPCTSFINYLIGWCDPRAEEYVLMGEDTPHTARGEYYLTTNAYKPFAQGFPRLKVQKRQHQQSNQQKRQQTKRQRSRRNKFLPPTLRHTRNQ